MALRLDRGGERGGRGTVYHDIGTHLILSAAVRRLRPDALERRRDSGRSGLCEALVERGGRLGEAYLVLSVGNELVVAVIRTHVEVALEEDVVRWILDEVRHAFDVERIVLSTVSVVAMAHSPFADRKRLVAVSPCEGRPPCEPERLFIRGLQLPRAVLPRDTIFTRRVLRNRIGIGNPRLVVDVEPDYVDMIIARPGRLDVVVPVRLHRGIPAE